MKKNNKKRYPYPDPEDDPETKNRKLRNLRAVSGSIRTEAPVDIRDIGNSQSAYNRRVNNEAKKSFRDIDKLREQVEFIEDLPNLKARKKASVKALTQKLINTPIQRWGVSLTQQFEGLGNKLQRAILRRKEKEGN